MNRMFWSGILLVGFVLWSSVSLAEEVKYRTHIKQVFDAKCLGCHVPQRQNTSSSVLKRTSGSNRVLA